MKRNRKWVNNRTLLTAALAIIFFIPGSIYHAASRYEKEAAWQLQDGEPVVRLHVRAAGDSLAEQNFKMELVMQVRHLLSENKPPQECGYEGYISFLGDYLSELEKSLQDYTAEAAAGTQIVVRLTQEHFPLKIYGRRIYPAGEYTALTVIIDEGSGENWWCLLFPSLCLPPVKIGGDSVEEEERSAPVSFAEPPHSNALNRGEKDKETARSGKWQIKVWEFFRRPINK